MLPNILLTKLFIPKIQQKFIKHGSLIDKIRDGIDKGNKLTLISAPAGYGKTTLVLEMVDSIDRKYSWISLDEGDNDLKRFLIYVISALKNAGIDISNDIEPLLLEPQLFSYNAILTLLINDISQSSLKTILVLDDYHVINSTVIHEAMLLLIEHQPPNLHLVLTTREDPPLMLPKLRVRRQMTEIRVDDLRFCTEEAEKYFSEVMGISLKKDAVNILNTRTEGWAAGLQLAGLYLKSYKDHDFETFIYSFNGCNRYVIDYLVEEVLRCQKDEVRDFLIKTSILDKMNYELCEAVTGREDSKEMLRELEQANLFIIPLDDKREWYRYHHLFSDSLKTELENEDKLILYKKAALWLDSKGIKQDAVKYAFKTKDMDLTIKIIENSVEDMFKNAELPTLVKWLDALPKDIVRQNEILTIRAAWALYITGNINRTIEYVNSLDENTVNNLTPHNRGLLLSLQALIYRYIDKGDGLQQEMHIKKLSAEALELLEEWDPMARIATLNTLGGALSNSGRTAEAIATYEKAYCEGLKLGYSFITTLSLLYYGVNLNISGNRQEAINIYEAYLEGIFKSFGRPLPISGIIYVTLGGLYYEGNDLAKAYDLVLKGIELCKSMSLNWLLNSEIWLAKILYAKGEKENALNIIVKACETSTEKQLQTKFLKVRETYIELLLREGHLEKALEVADDITVRLSNELNPVSEQFCLIYIRLLIALKRTDEALMLLSKVKETVKSGQRHRLLISVYISYAVIYHLKNESQKAGKFMEKALMLAETNDYIRVFLDDDLKVIEAILLTMKNSISSLGVEILNLINSNSKYETAENGKANACTPFEQLSEREMDLLRLIAEGLTNSDISKQLFISVNTTQWHISNIFSKLGVKNRTQAILRGKELNLL